MPTDQHTQSLFLLQDESASTDESDVATPGEPDERLPEALYRLLNIHLVDSLSKGRVQTMAVDGGVALTGRNGQGKTSLLALALMFSGVEPTDVVSKGKDSFIDYYLPNQTSYIVYPRVDDLSFYHSYHAMMITAGRLLSTQPVVGGRDESNENKFVEWLSRHDIARIDGRWLADRRDPEPAIRYDWPQRDEADAWLKSISAQDFERGLYPTPGMLTIWGQWSGADVNHSEAISVHSALVSPSTSASLLRAIQTVEHPHDFRIPGVDDELELATPPYVLKGWIQSPHHESGLDRSDPWAGNIGFPAPEPAAYVVELMNMSTDLDRRIWLTPSSSVPVMRSQTWGYSTDDEGSDQAQGVRLEASMSYVIEFLTAVGKDLVVEVEVERTARHQNYRDPVADELQYILPSNRIYIFRSDGTVRTL
ncbi:ATP-binding protein [Pseudomonas viridiflava]|uniref:ATP-binding protein n=1 Tax=Pseudomonas viridiflava TaxID=33069 RepID=UPI000F068C00|nr:ATP-binding protein [Pseudomonas viridiflava]